MIETVSIGPIHESQFTNHALEIRFPLFLHNDRHVQFRRVEEMLCHLGRHANTAVRSAVAGNEASVHSVPSRETKKIGHPCPNELRPRGRMVFARIYIRLYDPAIFRDEIPIDA